MMAHLVRSLTQWPKWHHQCFPRVTLHCLLNSTSLFSTGNSWECQNFIGIPSSHRNVHFRSRGLRLPDAPAPSKFTDTDNESDSDKKMSRNEKKREARRSFHWAMELATFSPSQIKRILRALSLEEEAFDALMLVKRLGKLGRDVREGRRRQFNYIGRLLREVQPELMDDLILATKDGDLEKLKNLSGSESSVIVDDDEKAEEADCEDEEEVSCDYLDLATRWFDGLINKDVHVTKEIYSLNSVEFDRQELGRLVRNFCSMQEREVTSDENGGEVDVALLSAKRSLTRFLRALAKQMATE